MILVTGGTGLVGSHLLYLLASQNQKIIAIYRSEEKLDFVKNIFKTYLPKEGLALYSTIKWVHSDITDIPSLEAVFEQNRITEVYHCAAIVSFDPNDYTQMRQINIEGTANIVNLSIDYSINKLCHVSSIATLGDAPKGKLVTEETEWNNETTQSAYAITKFGAEMEVWRGSQEGLNVVIVNPGVILGNGFEQGSSQIFEQVKRGLRFYTDGVTGFVGVQDVVNSMVSLMKSDIQNERFIVVSENKSYKDVLWMIADAFGVKRPTIRVGKIMMSITWRILYLISLIRGTKPVLTKNSAKSSQQKTYYTSDKIAQVLNFEFTRISKVITQVCKTYQ